MQFSAIFKKQITKQILAVLAVALMFAAGIGIVFHKNKEQFEDHFLEGTTINGFDVSRLTAEEAEELIRNEAEDYDLTLVFPDGTSETIPGQEIGYHFVSDGAVKAFLEAQDPGKWLRSRMGFQSAETSVNAHTEYDDALLAETLAEMPQLDEANVTHPEDAYMTWDETEFVIVPEVEGDLVDPEILLAQVKEALDVSAPSVEADDSIYVDPEIRSDNEELNALVEDSNGLVRCHISYLLPDGAEKVIDSAMLHDWLIEDLNGGYILPNEVVRNHAKAIVKELEETYNTVGKEVSFASTQSGDVMINLGSHGWKVDAETETEALTDLILSHMSVNRALKFSSQGFTLEENGIGDTYIEVDINNQHVYYYIDGELYMDTPCVTGTATNSSRSTPTGLYTLTFKTTNRYLLGPINPETNEPTYRSYVNYWMPFNGGVGFHDALWRSSFGGSIYMYSGSHGCVNMPYSAAEKMYQVIDKTTPIIVF